MTLAQRNWIWIGGGLVLVVTLLASLGKFSGLVKLQIPAVSRRECTPDQIQQGLADKEISVLIHGRGGNIRNENRTRAGLTIQNRLGCSVKGYLRSTKLQNAEATNQRPFAVDEKPVIGHGSNLFLVDLPPCNHRVDLWVLPMSQDFRAAWETATRARPLAFLLYDGGQYLTPQGVCANAGMSAPTTAGNTAECRGVTAPDTVRPGASFSATVTLKNTGTKLWTTDTTTADGDAVRTSHKLGSQNPRDNTRWGFRRVRLPSTPISPGQEAAFSFTAKAPTIRGTYAFDWKMVEELVQWFGETCAKEITVR
jgi:Ig-like domain-containing protein